MERNTALGWNPSWWKYSSPVLFPIVGKLANGKYRIGEHQYELPGHGLGRISDFVLVRKEKDAICLALDWSEDSLEKYPYKFRLEISYKLAGHTVQVGWQVKSQEEMRDMYSPSVRIRHFAARLRGGRGNSGLLSRVRAGGKFQPHPHAAQRSDQP